MSGGDERADHHHVVIALGANLGDSVVALRAAVESLAAHESTEVIAVSHAYATAPVGGREQPDYVNAVAVIRTGLAPLDVLALAHQIEAAHDRVRTERWGPRTLDIDVIAYDDLASDDSTLTLPHPRAHQRAFVLLPWSEIEPGAVLPGHGAISDLLTGVSDQRIKRLDADVSDSLAVAPPSERSR